jgi:hypothetical protein
MDLMIVGIYSFASVGAHFMEDQTPIALRVGAGARLRTHVYWSFGLRLELGADIAPDAVPFRASLLLGGTFARPFKKPRR